MTDCGIESRNYFIKRLGGAQGESLYFDFLYHLISPYVENSSPNVGGALFDCPNLDDGNPIEPCHHSGSVQLLL